MLEEELIGEECGVAAVYSKNGVEAANLIYFMLHALQHRGQESAGITASDGNNINEYKGLGLVGQVFNEKIISQLKGNIAIGHTRYSTTGFTIMRNAQPFLIDTQYGQISVAHNGNLVNAAELMDIILKRGVGLSSTTDSAILTMSLAGSVGNDWIERLKSNMQTWVGAYSIVIMTKDEVIAARDNWGFRPLSYGKLPNNSGYAVASETCALKTIDCVEINEIMPGEIIRINYSGLSKFEPDLKDKKTVSQCAFEHIYFSRPDSIFDSVLIHKVRQRLGEVLWDEAPVTADCVVAVPDTSIPAAIGLSRVSGIEYTEGLIKNRYIGRTFIEPSDALRKKGVKIKFNVLSQNIIGKKIILIDDSIVRGNTSGPLVKMLRDAGAKEIHMRITCPPIKHPCYMGVDMGNPEELIAHRFSVEQMKQNIDCDSLYFISLDGMMKAIGKRNKYCNACFTGKYPFALKNAHAKNALEKIHTTQV